MVGGALKAMALGRLALGGLSLPGQTAGALTAMTGGYAAVGTARILADAAS